MGCNDCSFFYPISRLAVSLRLVGNLSGPFTDTPDPKIVNIKLGHGAPRTYLPNPLLYHVETEAQKEEVIFPKVS